jgi:REP element-mobilizing transposase RayT
MELHMTPKAGSHRLRTGRYSQAGQVYLLTMVTLNRKQVFAEFQSARCLVRTLHEESRLGRANTWAYVVMPDHLHWLMQLGEQVDLGRCVQGVKSLVSRQLGQPIWQAGFHDRAMHKEENLQAFARYIVANPVRAGLVNRVGDYPHWDAMWL